jgi:hypothetical protein
MEDTWKENNLFCKNIEAIPHDGLKVVGAGLGRTGRNSYLHLVTVLLDLFIYILLNHRNIESEESP